MVLRIACAGNFSGTESRGGVGAVTAQGGDLGGINHGLVAGRWRLYDVVFGSQIFITSMSNKLDSSRNLD